MQRVTIKDIAVAANVSLGTASKVLNGDESVKESNRRAVQQAVERLGYNVNKIARSLAHKPIRIGVLLPSVFKEYYHPMLVGIENVVESLSDFKASAIYESYANYNDTERVVSCLQRFVREDISGIILGPSYVGTYSDQIIQLRQQGIPVVLVLSDLKDSGRIACVRIDAVLSGKTAADLAGLTLYGRKSATVFVGSMDVAEHRLKAESFLKRGTELGISVAGVYETQDEPQIAYRLTADLLKQNPELRLIYVATGNSVAVCQCINDHNLQGQVQVIATDTPSELQPYVKNGTVIGVLDQRFEQQGAVAVNTLYRYLTEGILKKEETRITPRLLLRSGILDRMNVKE